MNTLVYVFVLLAAVTVMVESEPLFLGGLGLAGLAVLKVGILKGLYLKGAFNNRRGKLDDNLCHVLNP